MRINADYTKQAIEMAEGARWRSSPSPGVERRMLDRVGDEVAVATSVVRYAPGSRFPVHRHERGEEYLVLAGVFSDASGNYGRGWYVRNPPGTAHAPWTEGGATILVKLRQFEPTGLRPVAVDTAAGNWEPATAPGTEVLRLHDFGAERVRMYRLAAGTELPARETPGGEEIYVVAGTLAEADTLYRTDTWIRNPPGSAAPLQASEDTVIWVKRGHLHPQFGPDRYAAAESAEQDSQDRSD